MKADKRILMGFALVMVTAVILMQFWQPDTTNPPVVSEPVWDDAQTEALVRRACYDCHSNETFWPWYTRIVPFSHLLLRDVENGRAVLNFSDWDATCCGVAQMNDMAETVNKREMPLPYYLVLHPEAQLTDFERGQLVNGLLATMNEQLGGEP
jgi:hypothetical protein